MASWEQGLRDALTQLAGGEDPIYSIDHETKVIEIESDARLEPSQLRSVDQAVKRIAPEYTVRQLF